MVSNTIYSTKLTEPVVVLTLTVLSPKLPEVTTVVVRIDVKVKFLLLIVPLPETVYFDETPSETFELTTVVFTTKFLTFVPVITIGKLEKLAPVIIVELLEPLARTQTPNSTPEDDDTIEALPL
jgi:hypothetical protein